MCIYLYDEIFLNVYIAYTFEIMFRGSLSCIPATHNPEMKDHRCYHVRSKTERMTLQRTQ